MKKTSTYRVAEWLASCERRFKNMYDADLDREGWPRLQSALKDYQLKGRFTVGQILYLWNRTDSRGAYPRYNKHRGYNRTYGEMLACPLGDLIDSNIVDWRTGANGVISQELAQAIAQDTSWQYKLGNLRPKHMTTYADLFGAAK